MKHGLRNAVWGAALVAAGALVPVSGHAFLLTAGTVNNTFIVDFLLEAGESAGGGLNTEQDLSAQALFKHTAWNGNANTLSIEVDVTNLSESLGNNVGLWKLAFGMDPTATSVTFTHILGDEKFKYADVTIDPAIKNAVLNLASGVQAETDPGYTCPSSNNKGCTLNEQEQQLFRLDFAFSGIGTGVKFSPFGSFWQTGYGSYQFGGQEGNGGAPPGGQIPEPATLALLGLGLLGVAVIRRRVSVLP